MTFILKMAWRDSRASRRRLVLFSLSVVLGIAALVAIGSFSANLENAIDEQAKGLLGADLFVTGRAAPVAEVQKYLDALGGEQSREIGFSSMMVFPTAQNLTRLVQVRAESGNFPFYGDFVTEPADAVARLRAGGNVVVLEETLLRQFNAKVGDPVKLGQATLTVVGALQKMPGESSAVTATFAPRALIPMSALDATGLAGKATLVRVRTALKLPATRDPDAIVRDMRDRFRGERLSFDTVAQRKRGLGRALENIQGFLSLVGFIALFLGAIGVASAIHVYVRQKITTVAVLRCLGASAAQSFAVYLVQGIALGIFGAALGAALGLAVQLALPRLLADVLPFQVNFFVAWGAVARGTGAGLVICVLFTVLPLLAVRNVSPLVALRSAFAERVGTAPDPWRIAIGVFIGGSITGFAVWQTHSVRNGFGFAGALAVGFGVLAGLAQFVAWAARRWLPKKLPYVARQGVANLYRPQNRTVLLMLSLGLGTFLMLTLFLTRTTLLKEIEISGGGTRPNLLFFDVQDDQIGPLTKITAQEGAPVLVSAPIVTMKIAKVNGWTVDDILRANELRRGQREERRRENGDARDDGERGRSAAGWTLRREYRSTFRGKLEATEKIVEGKFVPRVEPGGAVVPISMEQGLVEDMGIKLGDEIEWDVQGVPMRTKLASVRAVEWRRLEPNFFVVFPEGVLENAPKFYVAAVRAATPDDSARVQRAVVAALPNVTAIDLALVMQTVDSIFSKVAFVIEFMALFTVVTGVIVLAGAVLTGRFQRIRETVLLRTLGATRRQLTQIMLVEYAVLGVLAAITGGALALAANTLLAKFVFHLTPVLPPLELLAAVAAVVGVTLATGLLTNRGVTNHPPLEVLRNEV
ncbi:MAG TPA: FtsX-like permease family protein [Opitutaceae bacterium]|nr:FtsX-like permease family protein [Opitutaceae bacterium]